MEAKWGPIFKGDKPCHAAAVDFMRKYGQYLPTGPSFPEYPITCRQLIDALRRAGKSAPRADEWYPSELAYAPKPAVECL
eukprot:4872644-Alexandrium_andersonii.AAC.1